MKAGLIRRERREEMNLKDDPEWKKFKWENFCAHVLQIVFIAIVAIILLLALSLNANAQTLEYNYYVHRCGRSR